MLDLEVLPRIPVNIIGDGGVTVTKANGIVTIGFDDSDISASLAAASKAVSDAAAAIDTASFIYPLGAGADDWPTLYAALVANAYVRPTIMGPGTWLCKSFAGSVGRNVPDGSNIIMLGVTIESTLTPTPGGGQSVAVFGASAQSPAGVGSTTLSADANEGDLTIALTSVAIGVSSANLAVGNGLFITDGGNRSMYYFVRAVNTSTKVVTLDRPITTPFLSGCTAKISYAPKDIRIQGNGAVIRGTGDRAINGAAWSYSSVEGIRAELNSAGNFFSGANVISYDIGSRFSVMKDISVDGQRLSGPFFMVASECNESNYFENITARGGTGTNGDMLVVSSFHCTFNKITCGNGGAAGLFLDCGGTADLYGSRYNTFHDVAVDAGDGFGIIVQNGSSFNKFFGVDIRQRALTAININPGFSAGEQTRGNKFYGVTTQDNILGSLFVQATGDVTKDPINNLFDGYTSVLDGTVGDGSSVGLSIGGSTILNNILLIDCANNGIETLRAADCIITNLKAKQSITGVYGLVTHASTGVMTINGMVADASGSGDRNAIVQNSGRLLYDNCFLTGAAWTRGYASNSSSSRSRRGKNVDFNVAGSAFPGSGTGSHNYGISQLSSGTVTITNAEFGAEDRPMIMRQSLATGVTANTGHLYTPSVSAGSFTVTSTAAADDGVFYWRF